jgi:hypothetical protein
MIDILSDSLVVGMKRRLTPFHPITSEASEFPMCIEYRAAGSSNGRTFASGAKYLGSNPSPAALYSKTGNRASGAKYLGSNPSPAARRGNVTEWHKTEPEKMTLLNYVFGVH